MLHRNPRQRVLVAIGRPWRDALAETTGPQPAYNLWRYGADPRCGDLVVNVLDTRPAPS